MTEELDKLEAAIREIKIRFMYSGDPDDASQVCWFMDTVDADNFGLIMNAARAHLAAQRQAPAKTPLEYFSKNIDGRKTIEVFESACFALKKADEATVAGDDVKHEIWFNIFKCESMRLMREYEEAPNIRAALTNSVPVEVVREAYGALVEYDQLINHNFQGSREAMTDFTYASQRGFKALRELAPYIKKDENK